MPPAAANALILDVETAADLMTSDPVSIGQDAPLSEAVALLTEKDVSALPVLDAAGQPVGVLSRTDIIRYFHQHGRLESTPANGAGQARLDPATREVMTRAVLSVNVQTAAVEVVAQLLGLGNVQQLFVLDDAGAVAGVVSARDVLRRLRRLDGR